VSISKKSVRISVFAGLGIVAIVIVVYLSTIPHGSIGDVNKKLLVGVQLSTSEIEQQSALTKSSRGEGSNSRLDEIPSGIVFPDGTTIKVTWRWPQESHRPLTEPLGQHYQTLKQQALAGDSDAAFDLYRIGDLCVNAVETKSELSATKDKLLETHMVVLPAFGEKELYIENPDGVKNAIAMFEMEYERCIGVTAEMKSEKSMWLERAKDGGPSLATYLYASQLTDNSEAIGYLQQSWEAGFMLSLPLMAEKYMENYESGEEPTDDINAYATQLAYSKLLENRRNEFDSVKSGSVAPMGPEEQRANQSLEELASLMQDSEIAEAIDVAKEIVLSNSKCCLAF